MKWFSPPRKRAFRPDFPLKETCFCALICAAFPTLAALPAPPTQASPVPITHSAHQQINALALAEAKKQVTEHAAQKGWQDYSVKLEIFIPPAVAHAKPCPQQPEIGKKGGTAEGVNRLTFDVVCPAAHWDFKVTVKPQIYLPVVMANGEISRGETLSASQLVLKKYNISNGREAYVTDLNSLIGMTAKRNISPARPITSGMLQMPILVKRDQPVMMVSESGAIAIQTQGTALKDGRKGEAIRVRNDSSQRIVTAIVADEGVVNVRG